MILARIAGPSEENKGPGESSRMAAAYRGGSASAEPGFPVEQFAGDLQVAGVRGGLLDHMQDDPADVRDLPGVLRVMVKVEPARGRGQRGDGEDLVGSPALVAVVGDEVGAGPVAGEGGLGIIGAFFFLVPRFLVRRR